MTERQGIELEFTGDASALESSLGGIEGAAGRAQAALAKVDGQSSTLAQRAEQVSARWSAVGGVAAGVGGALTKGVTLPMAALAGAATKTAIGYEDAFAGVRKTVDGTEEELASLYEQTLALAEAQPVSATEIMNIEALGGQLGVATGNLLDFSRIVSGLDIATNLSADEAATQLAQFANIVGMTADDYSAWASTVVDLGNNTATTEADITAMAMRIAGAGSAAGFSAADILGLSAALSSVGIKAEAGGSAISTIISKIDKSVALSDENLATWADTAGMSADAFAAKWKANPVEALNDVIVHMNESMGSGGNLSLMLQELGITELRQTDSLKRLANSGDVLTKTVETANGAWAENTALQTEVDARNATTSAKLEVLKNKASNLAAEFGGPLCDALSDLIDDAEPLIKTVSELVEGFAGLSTEEQRTLIRNAAVVAGIGPMVMAFGKLASGVGNVAGMVGRLSGAFAAADKVTTATAAVAGVANVASQASGATTAIEGISAAAAAADAATSMPNATKAVGGVGDVAKASSGMIEGISAAASTTDAAVSMKAANKEVGSVGAVAKGSSRAIEGISAAADTVDATMSMKAANREVGSVGSVAKASSGMIEGISAAASTTDAAVSMKAANKEIGSVGAVAKGSSKAIEGISTAASATDAAVTMKAANKEVGSVGSVAKASSTMIEGISATASATDAAVTMKAANKEVGSVGVVAKSSSGLVEGIAASAAVADGITLANGKGAVTAVGDEAATAAGKIAGEEATALKGSMKAMDAAADASKAAAEVGKITTAADAAIGAAAAGAATGTGIAGLVAALGVLAAFGGIAVFLEIKNASEWADKLNTASAGIAGYLPDIAAVDLSNLDGLATLDSVDISTVATDATTIKDAADTLLDDVTNIYAKFAEDQTGLETNRALLDRYATTIAKYRDNADLSEREQLELNAAVDGFNQITGSTISVVDAVNGKLDTSQKDLESIAANWYEAAKAQGYYNTAVQLYEKQAEAQVGLQQAQATLAEVEAAAAAAEEMKKSGSISDWAAAGEADIDVDTARKAVEEYQATLDGVNASLDVLTTSSQDAEDAIDGVAGAQPGAARAAEDTAEAIEAEGDAVTVTAEQLEAARKAHEAYYDTMMDFIAASPGLAQAIAASGDWDPSSFTERLYEAGVSVDEFRQRYESLANLNDPLAAITQNKEVSFDTFMDNMLANIEATTSFGNTVTAMYEGAADEAQLSFVQYLEGLGPEYADFIAGMVDENGNLTAEFVQLAERYALEQQTVAQATTSATGAAVEASERILADGVETVEAGAGELSDAAEAGMADTPEKVAAAVDGAPDAIAQGFEGGAETVTAAVEGLESDAVDSLVDLNGQMEDRGYAAGGFVGYGIDEATELVTTAVSTLVDGAATEMVALGPLATAAGTAAGSAYALGIAGQANATTAGANALVDAAKAALGANDWARSSGLELGSNFALGIAAAAASVTYASETIAGIPSDYLNFSEPRKGPLVGINGSGYELGANYADSMTRSTRLVSAAASKLASAASFGAVPDGWGYLKATSAQAGAASYDNRSSVTYNNTIGSITLNDDEEINAMFMQLMTAMRRKAAMNVGDN